MLRWDEVDDVWRNEPAQNRRGHDFADYQYDALSSDVALTTAGTYYAGPSVLLGAGVWLVTATVTYYRTATTAANITIKLGDTASNTYCSTQVYHESLANISRTLSLSRVLLLYYPTRVYVYGASSAGGSTGKMVASCPSNGSPGDATHISAVKINNNPRFKS